MKFHVTAKLVDIEDRNLRNSLKTLEKSLSSRITTEARQAKQTRYEEFKRAYEQTKQTVLA